jgi:hypothetical protein
VKLPESLKELLEKKDNEKREEHFVTRFGRQFEQFFFGFTIPDSEIFQYRLDEYIPFPEALQEVKDAQFEGYNPSFPSGGCNKDFFDAVRKHLLVSDDSLEYFIAIGTKLDFWHGVDAFFEWRGVGVTIDATLDPEKIRKADFLITPELIESGEIYTVVAREIASLLVTRVLNILDPLRVPIFLVNTK